MSTPSFEDVIFHAIYELAVDHPMWIGDDGQPLDYLPEREARIGDFVRQAAAAVLAARSSTATADTGLRDVLAEHFWHPPVPNPQHAMHLGGCYCGWQCRLAFGESRIDQYVDHLHAAILDATAAPTTDTGSAD